MKFPILLPNVFNHPFTYESDIKLKVGDFVEVPFGKTKITGVVWNEFEKNNSKKFKIKKVINKLDIPSLKKNTLDFLNWFSEYNIVPNGMALKLVLTGGKELKGIDQKFYDSLTFNCHDNLIELTNDQKKSLEQINSSNKRFNVHVLQGTTGSGKTFVYFEALKNVLLKGFQGLILLPEIGLTTQFEKKFTEFFKFKPAIWHSGITKKNKKIIWEGIIRGKISVVIGARSSLFLPFKNLGLIIVDEEHDQSYKQDEGVTYNARDMAISRASFEKVPINLITSVPSLETYVNIKKKKYNFSRLEQRYQNASLPNFEIINLNHVKLQKQSWLSKEIIQKVNFHLEKKDQVLFFFEQKRFFTKCFM